MKVKIISNFEDIQQTIPRCIKLAHKVKANIPFHYMHLPLLWWQHYNNTDGTVFSQKRGKNFLGLQSKLNEFYLVIVEDKKVLCGAVPLVSYTLELPDEDKEYRVLAFAGDYIAATCQDFLVLPEKRSEIIQLILSNLIDSFSFIHDLLFFGHIPEFSENIPYLREHIVGEQNDNINYLEKTTARKGGVWPWTLVPLRKVCKGILKKVANDHITFHTLQSLTGKLEKGTSLSLLFPRNRAVILEDLFKVQANILNDKNLKHDLEEIKYCLNPATIFYPYINLPNSRDAYWQSLSKSKQYYFRRYLKRFQESGGRFEKITAVTEKDIDDCIRLHLLRWGKDSTVICGVADAFHQNLGMAMAKEDMFTIFFATLNNKRIAAQNCFDIGNRREFYLSGRDPKYDNSRAGSLLMMETILDGINHEFSVYDLGVVAFPYKMDFTKTVYSTKNFFIYRNDCEPDLNKIFNSFVCMN